MIAACDVHYGEDGRSSSAAVLFKSYADDVPAQVYTRILSGPTAAYLPGKFYLRELPCIMALLEEMGRLPDEIIVDGYVMLGDKAGLGRHLFEALKGRIPVIGVAKNRFKAASGIDVLRGGSRRPLLVTAAGMPVNAAAERIKGMHGDHRLPTLLKCVDGLARENLRT